MADDRQLLIKFILQDQTKRGFDSVNKQVAGTKRSLFSLKNAVLGIAGSLVVRQTLELANTYQNLQNRLKLVTDSTSELASVQQDLFEISQRTRGGFAETVELYQKLALQSQSLGLQSSELSQITENVNKVIAIAGVNSVQASAGILQLSQAFASGRLQGDEFRSISENIPPLLDIFAKELGVTRGELKKLGSEGKITSEIIASALLKETENINEAFGQLSPTIGQASTTVGNSFLNLVGKFTEVTGASDLLAESLITVSNELDEISKTIELFAGVKLKDVDKAFQENADSIKTLITTTNELDNILGQIGLVRESEIFGVKTLSNEYSELEKALLKYREELEKVITTEDESDTTGKTGTDLSEEIKKLEKLIKANESGLETIFKTNEKYGKNEYALLKMQQEEELKAIREQEDAIKELIQLKREDKQGLKESEYEQYLKTLEEFKEQEKLINQRYLNEELELEKKKQEELKKIQQQNYDKNLSEIKNRNFQFEDLDKMSEENKVKLVKEGGRQLLDELAKRNKVAFAINKALAIRDAIISTSQGMASALKWGYPLGPIFAGIIGGLGAVQIGTIASQQYQGRALGGRVQAGSTYMVGEQGAEMFVPDQSGTIVANKDLGIATNVNITINANDTQGFDDLLVKRRSVIVNVINDALNSQGKEALI